MLELVGDHVPWSLSSYICSYCRYTKGCNHEQDRHNTLGRGVFVHTSRDLLMALLQTVAYCQLGTNTDSHGDIYHDH